MCVAGGGVYNLRSFVHVFQFLEKRESSAKARASVRLRSVHVYVYEFEYACTMCLGVCVCLHSNACMYVCVKAYCFYLSVREQSCVCVCAKFLNNGIIF